LLRLDTYCRKGNKTALLSLKVANPGLRFFQSKVEVMLWKLLADGGLELHYVSRDYKNTEE
jgi:hypothetical protein